MEENKPGPRSKYKPEYCEMLVEHMNKGYSFGSFAGLIGVCEDTLYEWAKVHSAFSETKKRAFAGCKLEWERLGIEHIIEETEIDVDSKISRTKKLNNAVWIFNMKNRFGWRDRVEKEVIQREPVKIEITAWDNEVDGDSD